MDFCQEFFAFSLNTFLSVKHIDDERILDSLNFNLCSIIGMIIEFHIDKRTLGSIFDYNPKMLKNLDTLGLKDDFWKLSMKNAISKRSLK